MHIRRLWPALVLVYVAVAAAADSRGDAPPVTLTLGEPRAPIPAGTPPSPVEHQIGPPAAPQVVWDVTRATLLAFAPQSPARDRTAVLILPGGGGRVLSLQQSVALARALQDAGLVAMVLKYRTQPLNLTAEQFEAQMREDPRIPPAPPGVQRIRFEDIQAEVRAPSPYRDMQVDDVLQALTRMREQGARWGVDPGRIILVGQSNGGILVSEFLRRHARDVAVLGAAMLYGAPPEAAEPVRVPLYLAVALDDVLTVDGTLAQFAKWRAAGVPAELHVYQSGGHGFRAADSSGSRSWMTDFAHWARSLVVASGG